MKRAICTATRRRVRNRLSSYPRSAAILPRVRRPTFERLESRRVLATVSSVIPPANSHLAESDTEISIALDTPFNPAGVPDGAIRVFGSQSELPRNLPAPFVTQGNTVTLQPPRPFYPGELVHVTATSDVKDSAGQAVDPYVFTFRTRTTGGTGFFGDAGARLGDAFTYAAALGDLDGDGDLDAFVANRGANTVWRNDGQGNFVDTGQRLGSSTTFAVALGDLDGDGDLDAFLANSYREANKVWLNDGAANFTDSGQHLGNSRSRSVALGDLDADGDLDAFVGNGQYEPESNRVWLNDGRGRFRENGQQLRPDVTSDVVLGDLDGDGDLDAVTGNGSDSYGFGADRVWLNDGNGQFTPGLHTLGNSVTKSVALGDVDGDRDLDIVKSTSESIWSNLSERVNLSVTITNGQQSANAGDETQYTIRVVNRGQDADGVRVSDVFPSQLTDVTWTCSATAGSQCTADGQGDIQDAITLRTGAVATYAVTAVVAANAKGPVINTVTAEVAAGTADFQPANNTATDVDALAAVFGPLQPGDANQDGYVDENDILQVLKGGKYLSGESASWSEGDWNGAPGGQTGDPPAGDGVFDPNDITLALNTNVYRAGAYADVGPPRVDAAPVCRAGPELGLRTTLGYSSSTGGLWVWAPSNGRGLSSLLLVSRSGALTGSPAENLGGDFDVDTDTQIFKADFDKGFGALGRGALSLGNVLPPGLSTEFLLNDLLAAGSLVGGGDAGPVGLSYSASSFGRPVPAPRTVAAMEDVTVRQGTGPILNHADLGYVFLDTHDPLIYSVAGNTNADLVTVTIDEAGIVDLFVESAATGLADVTVRATDRCGNIVEDTFRVTVGDQVVPGDANRDGSFNQQDIVQVLQAAKYLTGQPATWSEGDWNVDGVFDQEDIVAALRTGSYSQGPQAAIVMSRHAKRRDAEADPSPEVLDTLMAELGYPLKR